MDHFTSPQPPHPDVARAPAADILALANYEHEPPLSIAETINCNGWLAGAASNLAGAVGSSEALEALDDRPHAGDESVDLTGLVPADAALAKQIGDYIDQADLMLDGEMVTIISRIVSRLAAHPDKPLHRRAKTDRIAAGIVWLALKGNHMISSRRGGWRTSDIWSAFNTSSARDLGQAFVHPLRTREPEPSSLIGVHEFHELDDPALLHSKRRRMLVEQRHDLKRAIRDQHQTALNNHPIQVRSDRSVRFATTPTTMRWAMRSPDESGRETVMIAHGDLQAMRLLSVSVTDAYRLLAALEFALNEPVATAS